MQETLTDFLEECEFADTSLAGDDLFAILESLEDVEDFPAAIFSAPLKATKMCSKESEDDQDGISRRKRKRPKLGGQEEEEEEEVEVEEEGEGEDKRQEGQTKMSHIAVERNRRKQMNEHLSVLRSLMPCFYVKRGDQASIIGGVVEYISELQQVLQSLEAKKQRKAYSDVLSPRLNPSPRPSQTVHSPRKPPLSPRLHPHLSPRTPQPSSPYRSLAPKPLGIPQYHHQYHHNGLAMESPHSPYSPSPSSSPSCSVNSSNNPHHESGVINELVANSKSPLAEVEVKFSGANVLLKTVSHRIPGQVVKIISALEDLALEILQVDINTADESLLSSFTIKIGIECQLSAEELAQQIQQTFC